MTRQALLLVAFVAALFPFSHSTAARNQSHPSSTETIVDIARQFDRPPDDARLMMRWWWFGPAVTDAELDRELVAMRDAGIGGVEIQPVYPLALDDPAAGIHTLPFLSPEFREALRFASDRARALGLRVDLTVGSGWPYGGPTVRVDHAAARLRIERVPQAAGQPQAQAPSLAPGETLIAQLPDASGHASSFSFPAAPV